MKRGPIRAVWLCAMKELRRHAKAWVGLAVVFGLLGGGATFAAAGADRTGSAFDRLAETTLAADLVVGARCSDDTCIDTADKLAGLPGVLAAAPLVNFLAAMDTPDGKPLSIGDEACYTGAGEINLLLPIDDRWGSSVNRFDLVEGSLPDPASIDQVLIASEVARLFGLHVGDRLSLHGDACDQPEGVTPKVRTLRVVGIERSTLEQRPDIGFYLLGVHGTTVLSHALRREGTRMSTGVALRVRGNATEAQVLQQATDMGIEIQPLLSLAATRRGVAKSTRPDSVAVLILGMFAAIAALVVVGPALIQQAAAAGPELRTLRILGLTTTDLSGVGLVAGLVVGLASALIAGVLAVALSPLSPIGEARASDPDLGTFVSAHMAIGMLLTALAAMGLTAIGTVLGARPTRLARFRSVTSAARMVRTLRLRPTMATGVRMALEPRAHVTSMLALFGVFAGVVGLIAVMTFSSSLAFFDRTPSLVGWNWDMAAFLSGEEGDEPPTAEMQAEVRTRLLTIPGVSGASLATYFPPQFSLLSVDSYPMAFSTGVDAIRPTVIDGRAPAGPSEVLLNPRLAKRLRVTIGDRVDLGGADPNDRSRSDASIPFEVVGTGVVPVVDGRVDIGYALTLDGLASLVPGSVPHMALLDLAPGADRGRVKGALVSAGFIEGSILDETPTSSKIVQLDTERVSATPSIAAGLFGITAAAILAHSVISSGRRRRHELAIYRAIGFSTRQATWASIWQGVTSTFVAVVLGVPLGAAVGGKLWSLYAESLGVQVRSSTSTRGIVLVVGLGLVGAAVVALWPAWLATRRATATALRAD